MDYGLKVSKLGDDVGTATLNRDLQFTSKFSGLKLYQAGTASFTTDGFGNGSAVIDHDLGFAPAYFVWRKLTAQNTQLSGTTTYPNSYIPVGVPSVWENITYSSKGFGGYIHSYTDSSSLYIIANEADSSTNYIFKYYYLVDLANEYSGTMASITTADYGFKVSKEGVDVKTAKEYELGYSSKYKALQYYDVSTKIGTMVLPNATASIVDTDVTGGTYIDFLHGLGYAPFYMAYYQNATSSDVYEIPDYSFSRTTGKTFELVSSFCDSTRVRLSWWKTAYMNAYGVPTNDLGGTVYVKLMVFTENLAGTAL